MENTIEKTGGSEGGTDFDTRHLLKIVCLGKKDYSEVLTLQRRLVDARANRVIPDTLVLVEHHPVITVGRSGQTSHIVASSDVLARNGIAVYEVERGGNVTYHGPGQLVGYPIMMLPGGLRGAVRFLRNLEEVLIQVLHEFGVTGYRRPGMTGVWTDEGKVAAIGVAVRRNVTFHGFALNVDTNLSHFEWIIPCGLAGERVTNLSRLVGHAVPLGEVGKSVIKGFTDVFGVTPKESVTSGEMPVEWM
ncbi:MAG: lipoyl(octanoyl) transferase LipB [bacterium JZ-2024 1]